MKATVTIKSENNNIAFYDFKTVKDAVEFAKHKIKYPFITPLTWGLNRIDVYVNINSTGKNVFYKFKIK